MEGNVKSGAFSLMVRGMKNVVTVRIHNKDKNCGVYRRLEVLLAAKMQRHKDSPSAFLRVLMFFWQIYVKIAKERAHIHVVVTSIKVFG